MLQKDSIVPLYQQIESELLEKIKSKEFPVGSMIPSEKELITMFPASRLTIRKAVSRLVDQGILYKKQGKGTFVSSMRTERNLLDTGSYTDFMLSNNQEPSRKIISQEIIPASGDLANKLTAPINSNIFKMIRVVKFDVGNYGMEIAYYALNKYPGLNKKVTDKTSMTHLLSDDYGEDEVGSQQKLSLLFASSTISENLQIGLGDPVFQLERLAFDRDNQVIDYTINYYNALAVSFNLPTGNQVLKG